MFDLKNLNKEIEFKGIDTLQLLKIVLEHWESFLKMAFIAGTLMAALISFNAFRVKAKDLADQISQAQQKIGAISQHNSAVAAFSQFKSQIPAALSQSELITRISNYARLSNVDLPSLTPNDPSDMGLFDMVTVDVTVDTGDFKNVLKFLREIENSKEPLMIISWSGNFDNISKVNYSMRIAAIFIHTS